MTDFRKYDVWGSYLAGAGGCEFFQDGDGHIDDFRPYESFYTTLVRAQQFIQDNVPYSSMEPTDGLVSGVTGYCLAKTGRIYLVYLPAGGTASLNLTGATGVFDVSWFDPRNGGGLQTGSVARITGGTVVSLGNPPNNTGSDWTALVRIRDAANLTAVAVGLSQINLSWTPLPEIAGVSEYLIERCEDADCTNFVPIAAVATTGLGPLVVFGDESPLLR